MAAKLTQRSPWNNSDRGGLHRQFVLHFSAVVCSEGRPALPSREPAPLGSLASLVNLSGSKVWIYTVLLFSTCTAFACKFVIWAIFVLLYISLGVDLGQLGDTSLWRWGQGHDANFSTNFEPYFLIGLELVFTRSYTWRHANDTLWLHECPTCISATVFKSRYNYQLLLPWR